MAKQSTKTILVDLGGVLTHPELGLKLTTSHSAVPLRRIMSTSIWMTHEEGYLSEEQCFGQLADQYGFHLDDLMAIMHKLRDTITYDQQLATLLKIIKETSGVQMVLASNISKEDYLSLRQRWDDDF